MPDRTRDRRGVLRNGDVRRSIVSHALATIAEWAALIGVLVYAFDHGGARAAGYASLASLAPYTLLSSATAHLAQRHPPAFVRLWALAAQTGGYGIAAACALARWPSAIVVAGAMLAFAGVTSLRPTGAVLLPALVRSSRELTSANVWIGHCESASVLLGPLAATVLLGVGGGGMVLLGCCGLTALATVVATRGARSGPPAVVLGDEGAASPTRHDGRVRRLAHSLTSPFHAIVDVGRRQGSRGLLVASMGQYLIVGALDIILVVIAGEHLDLGDAGAGVLTALFGVGAFLSSAVAGRTVNGRRLAPLILASLAVIAGACTVFGLGITLITAVVVLPVLGCSRSLLDLMVRVLFQRSAPPSQLAALFGALETSAGLGLLGGSLFAQILIAAAGPRAALLGLGALYAVLAVSLVRPLRTADDGADVPVVAMSLLRQLPVFESLPTFALEAVARSSVEVPVAAGEMIIRQHEHGDSFYAVADGTFDVTVSGVHVRTLGRGTGFGEVALLADVARTATVTAMRRGELLEIERGPFLLAVTGYDSSEQAVWRALRLMTGGRYLSDPGLDDLPAGAGED